MAIFYADYVNGDDANDGTIEANPVKDITALVGSLSPGDEVRVKETNHTFDALSGTFTSDRTAHTISTSVDHTGILSTNEYIRVQFTDELGNAQTDYLRIAAVTSSLITLDVRNEFIPDGSSITAVHHIGTIATNTDDFDINGVVGTEANPIKISGGWKFGTDTVTPTGETLSVRKSTSTSTAFFDISAASEYLDIENFIILGNGLMDNGKYIKLKDIYVSSSTGSLSTSESVGEDLFRGVQENVTMIGNHASSFSRFLAGNTRAIEFNNCRFVSHNITSTSDGMFYNCDNLTFTDCEFSGIHRFAYLCNNLVIDNASFISNEASSNPTAWIDECYNVQIKNSDFDYDVMYNQILFFSDCSQIIVENCDISNIASTKFLSNCYSVEVIDCDLTLDSGIGSPVFVTSSVDVNFYNCAIELKPSANSFATSSGPLMFYDCTVTNPDSISEYLGNYDDHKRTAFHRFNSDNDNHAVCYSEWFLLTIPDDTHSTSLSFKIESKEANISTNFEIYTFIVTDAGSDIDLDIYYKTDSEPDLSCLSCYSDGKLIDNYVMQFIEDVKETSPSATGISTSDWCKKTITIPSANLTVGREIKLLHKMRCGAIAERVQFDFSPAT